jgi:hypothetical protein
MVQSHALRAAARGYNTQSTWARGQAWAVTGCGAYAWDIDTTPLASGRVHASGAGIRQSHAALRTLTAPLSAYGASHQGAAASNPLGTSKRCGRMVVRTTFSLLSCTSSITLAAAIPMMLHVVMRHTPRPLRPCREPAHARHSSSPALPVVHDRSHTEASSFPSKAPTAHPLSFPPREGHFPYSGLCSVRHTRLAPA